VSASSLSTGQPRSCQQQNWHASEQQLDAHSRAGLRLHYRGTHLRKETEDQNLHIQVNTQRKKSIHSERRLT
jgi:hypothetical protein